MTKIIEPVGSQQLYEFILNNKNKLPSTYRIKNMTLTAKQLEEIYEIVSTNRAKTRGTRLSFETNEDGDVQSIEYEAIIIAPKGQG